MKTSEKGLQNYLSANGRILVIHLFKDAISPCEELKVTKSAKVTVIVSHLRMCIGL